jgi:hypothetical protein
MLTVIVFFGSVFGRNFAPCNGGRLLPEIGINFTLGGFGLCVSPFKALTWFLHSILVARLMNYDVRRNRRMPAL